MALSFLNIFKKDDKETESTTQAQEFDPKENAEASQGDAPKKGKQGEGTCCGSCS